MPLPVIFGPLTSPQLGQLDQNFSAVGALTVTPCTAVGANAVVLTPFANTPNVGAYANFALFSFIAQSSSTSTVTIAITGLSALPLYLQSGVAAGAGALVAGTLYIVGYNSALNAGSGGFQLIAGSTATLAQASGVAGSAKNLKVTNGGSPTTQVAVTADEVIIETVAGATYKATSVNVSISTGSNGVNGLDVGSVAASTWYSVWIIYNGTTVAGLISTSATAPTMPSGYTYKARVGWMVTDGSAHLVNTLQLGKRAQYVAPPLIANGVKGTYSATAPAWAAQAVTAFVPSTASEIGVIVGGKYNNGTASNVAVAPNNGYAGTASTTPPPGAVDSGAPAAMVTVWMVLESTNIYLESSAAGAGWWCQGWTDGL